MLFHRVCVHEMLHHDIVRHASACADVPVTAKLSGTTTDTCVGTIWITNTLPTALASLRGSKPGNWRDQPGNGLSMADATSTTPTSSYFGDLIYRYTIPYVATAWKQAGSHISVPGQLCDAWQHATTANTTVHHETYSGG